MCTSEAKVTIGVTMTQPPVARINGRPVLQPTCNHVPGPALERHNNSVKKITLLPPPTPISNNNNNSLLTSANPRTSTTKNPNNSSLTPPISPKSKSPRPPAAKRGNELSPIGSENKVSATAKSARVLDRKKSKSFKGSLSTITSSSDDHIARDQYYGVVSCSGEASLIYSSALITESPGSIAAVRREQMALQHAQRKMRIAHYGRSKSARFDRVVVVPLITVDSFSSATTLDHNNVVDNNNNNINTRTVEEKRCSFITPNSDPVYVAYHDQEWGVPVHDDKLLFELLVLSGAQVGSDWTSILKKRQEFRDAFSWFEAETVSTFTDKQMMSISSQYAIDISRVRGVIDNSNRILEIKKEFGSFEKYIWGFVNNKPISTQYKSGQRIPVKTSKSETISKDMVRRGFRFVGPTVVHSFMQAAGLTNDHLTTCHRHRQCAALVSARPRPAAPEPSL